MPSHLGAGRDLVKRIEAPENHFPSTTTSRVETMSIASAAPSPHLAAPDEPDRRPPGRHGEPAPRVRQLAREAVTLMAFSAGASVGVAACFLLLALAARQA